MTPKTQVIPKIGMTAPNVFVADLNFVDKKFYRAEINPKNFIMPYTYFYLLDLSFKSMDFCPTFFGEGHFQRVPENFEIQTTATRFPSFWGCDFSQY